MRKCVLIQLLAFSFVLFNAPRAFSADLQPKNFVLCKSQNMVRTLQIFSRDSAEGCRTLYSKAGKDEVVEDNRSLASCKTTLSNIQRNLESSNWKCKSANLAKVTRSSELTR